MNPTRFTPAWLALAAAFASAPALAATTYRIAEAVQFLPGTTTAVAGINLPSALNSRGQMLGQCANCNVFDPATGTLTSVRNLADGGTLFQALGLNASGQVAGSSFSSGAIVRNADGTVIPLAVPAGHRPAWAHAINDLGVSVGLTRDASIVNSVCSQRAARWDAAGNVETLPSLTNAPYPWAVARGLNRLGQVVGQSATPLPSCGTGSSAYAVLFTPTGAKNLHHPSLPPVTPGLSSVAVAINDQGLAAGHIPISGIYGAQVSRAIVWNTSADTYVLMGDGVQNSSLRGINNAGTVVGVQGNVAVVGDAATGALTDLNTLVPGKPAGWTLLNAVAINDAGQIAVEGIDAALGRVAFVLTPTGTTAAPTPAPSQLVATAISATQVRLNWTDNASNETGQVIRRCNVSGCSAPITVAANATSYTDGGLATGFAYTYTVLAQGPGGDSAPSNSATATPVAPPTPPAAPSGLVATASAVGQVTLSWTDNAANETGYSVYRCQGQGCTSYSLVAALGADATGFQDTTVRRGTRYSYRVRAANSVGNSAYAGPASVLTLR